MSRGQDRGQSSFSIIADAGRIPRNHRIGPTESNANPAGVSECTAAAGCHRAMMLRRPL